MDFVINKVLKRSFLAAIVPMTIYNVVWVLMRIFMEISYFNNVWKALCLIILVPGFSQAPLWMLFTPIEYLINKKAAKMEKRWTGHHTTAKEITYLKQRKLILLLTKFHTELFHLMSLAAMLRMGQTLFGITLKTIGLMVMA